MPKGKKKNLTYEHLKTVWTKRHKELEKEIFEKHKDSFEWLSQNSKQFAVGSLAGLFLLTSPIIPKIPTAFSSASAEINKIIDKKIFLVYDLKNILPSEVRPLTQEEEANVSEVLTRTYGFRVTPELEGKRLNTSYGLIGQEQHLKRYPGDNMLTHFDNPEDAEKYFKYGMAPGLGAWRYFAYSKAEITQEDIDREKYYIAVQTFLAPGFNENVREYVNFFKYRKMLVVNPQNGKAMVVVVGDAGPAKWTGKSLGGSPEVMTYLERYDGRQRGPVLYFFIDDPDDKIPLGPVSM
ncbi:MAG: hypothetical protein AAB702_00415 [Patescibacteria group bacterium]